MTEVLAPGAAGGGGGFGEGGALVGKSGQARAREGMGERGFIL